MNSSELKFHEKCTLLILMGVMAAIGFNAWMTPLHEEELLSFKESLSEVVVNIQGAVAHPGRYKVKIGTPVKEAIELAKVLPEANLSRVKLDNEIVKARSIKVPFKKNSSPKKKV